MEIDDLIAHLTNFRNQHGNIKVFSGDMLPPNFEIRESDDEEQYGKKYLYFTD